MLRLKIHSAISIVLLLSLLGCEKGDNAALPETQLGLKAPVNQTSGIIPRPAQARLKDGEFEFNHLTQIIVNDSRFKNEALYWQKEFVRATNLDLPIVETQAKENVLRLNYDGSLAQEAYRLDITNQQVDIFASDSAGAFYALQSLKQLLPAQVYASEVRNNIPWRVPAIEISDAPEYEWRGMHLDVGRSYMPVWFIKRYIDLLAMHKLNRFHWHLTEDQGWRIEIDSFPLLTEKGAWRDSTVIGHTLDKGPQYDNKRTGGFYTKEEIKDIVAYATQRHIVVVPEIDVPGHASAILHAYPQFGCTGEAPEVEANFGVFKPTLCPTEATFDMLALVFKEVAELFPGDYIHVGGDEVRKDEWQQSAFVSELMQRENLKNYHEVQSYFIHRVGKIVSSLNKKMIGWNEILDGGIAPDAIIMSWQGIEGGIKAAELGHDAIMTPGNYTYFDHYQSRSIEEPMAIHGITPLAEVYSYNPVPEELAGTEKADHILGVQGQLWSEYQTTPRKVEYMVLPRMSALAEIAWTNPSNKDWQHFTARLPKLFERFDVMGVNAARSVYSTNISAERIGLGAAASYKIEFSSDSAGLEWVYSTDGSEPGRSSKRYTGPFDMAAGEFVRVRARSIATGELYSESVLRTVKNKLAGAKLTLLGEHIDRAWNTQPEQSLVDGISKIDQIFQLDDWPTFSNGRMEAVIELAEETTINKVSLGYNPGLHRKMYAPSAIVVWASDDGEHWRLITQSATPGSINTGSINPVSINTGSINPSSANPALEITRHTVSVKTESVKSKWLKIVAENPNQVPDTQTKSVMGVTLYIDEIIVQ